MLAMTKQTVGASKRTTRIDSQTGRGVPNAPFPDAKDRLVGDIDGTAEVERLYVRERLQHGAHQVISQGFAVTQKLRWSRGAEEGERVDIQCQEEAHKEEEFTSLLSCGAQWPMCRIKCEDGPPASS